MKRKKAGIIRALPVILIIVSFLVIYLANRAVPFMMDDEWYGKKLFSEEPLSSFGDIVEFQVWHYHNWGGRSITHTILQLMLMAGEHAADICNTAATALLGGMVCLAAGVKKRDGRGWSMLAAVSMILGLNASWKMSMFWQAGAANYLYITIFILAFLHCYLRELSCEPVRAPVTGGASALPEGLPGKLPGITLWILPLGVIAGWSNENMGPAAWVVSLLVMGLLVKRKRRIQPWMILGNLACLAGGVLVVAAPGNFVRSGEAAASDYGILWKCFLRCYGSAKAALEFMFPVLLVLFGVVFLYKGVFKKVIGERNGLFLFGALLSWGAMILSPHYPDRATFGTMLLLICAVISMANGILRERRELQPWFWGGTVLIWLRGMYFLGEFLAISWGWIK